MNPDTLAQRKLLAVVTRYITQNFSEANWLEIGQITGLLDEINSHPRLLRSMSFGDDDYDYCVAEILEKIFKEHPEMIEIIVDHFDIDLWYQAKEPKKFERIFGSLSKGMADFWSERYLRVFISHLSSNKAKVQILANALQVWGLETFVAHEDIEPSREWMIEVEKGLNTMDVLIAVVEPGFKESNWCDQEVGYALGRGVDTIPLRAGLDPYGFFGKYQGLQIKGKLPEDLGTDVLELFLRKPRLYQKIIPNIASALLKVMDDERIKMIKKLDSFGIILDEDMKMILEGSNLDNKMQSEIDSIIQKVHAFSVPKIEPVFDDDIPF